MSHFGAPVTYQTANDPLFRMRAYRLAVDLLDVARQDAKTSSEHTVTERMSGQLYAAVSSIGSNIGALVVVLVLSQSAIIDAVGP
jgi:hypothetical protein